MKKLPTPSTIVTLDWETFYDTKDKYKLKNKGTGLPTSEYIRDPRFKAHGAAIKVGDQEKSKWYNEDKVGKKLASINWSKYSLLCHNTAFDGLICSHHYGAVPYWYFDTLSMARALLGNTIGHSLNEVTKRLGKGSKIEGTLASIDGIRDLTPEQDKELGVYAIQDNDLCFEIFMEWYEDYPEDELRLINHTIGAFANPILHVDIPRVRADLKRTRSANTRMFNKVGDMLDLNALGGQPRRNLVKEMLTSNRVMAKKYEGIRIGLVEADVNLNTVQKKFRSKVISAALRNDKVLSEALERINFDVPMKTTAKGNRKPAFSKTDLAFQEMLTDENEQVRLLAQARQTAQSNIAESRALTLIKHAEPALPIMLNYCRAHTMRWSGGDDLNPQNFPSRG